MARGVVQAALLVVLAAAAGHSQDKAHPNVDVESGSNNPDLTKCVTCHQDKASGSVVHAAVQAGCDACHAVERYKDQTDVFLRVEGNELCFQCHEDKKPQATQPTVHLSVRKELCTACHDAHTSAAPHLLKRSTEGRDPATNLCLGCHAPIAEILARPTQHAAVDMGCGTCHTTHKSEPASEPQGIYHLNSPTPALCLDCHGGDVPALEKAHQNQPVEKSNCAECHNPHGSDAPKLLNSFVHAPFEAGGCDTCHAAPNNGTVQPLEGARRTLCLACHSDVEEALAQAKVKHVPAEMDDGCVSCHSPHATNTARQLRQGPVRTCLACHADLAEARATKEHLHAPVFSQGCAVCHQPHGGQQERLLRAEINDLCMECHDPGITAKVRTQQREKKPVSLFGGKVEVAPEALAGIHTIQLLGNKERGHPLVPRHPVRGKYQLGEDMSCVTCHAPHAANGNPRLMVTESGRQQDLCRKCHQEDKR